MVRVIFWVLFGASVGWTIAILHELHGTGRTIMLVAVGSGGGLLGGLVGTLLNPPLFNGAQQTTDITFVIIGAATLAFIAGIIVKRYE